MKRRIFFWKVYNLFLYTFKLWSLPGTRLLVNGSGFNQYSESTLHRDAWNVISSLEIFKHGGSSVQFTVFSIQLLNKGRKGFIVSTSDNRNYTNWMSNCHKCYTNVSQQASGLIYTTNQKNSSFEWYFFQFALDQMSM